MVISSVTTQVGGFMTTVPTDELGYMGYQINASFSQDKIISELVDAFRSLNSRYGNTYFNITYLGASGGYHQFQLYYG